MRSIYFVLLLSVAINIAGLPAVFASDAVTLTEEAEQLILEPNIPEAKDTLNTVITDYPNHEKTWHARVKLAECLYLEKKYDECILEARKVVNMYPSITPQVQAQWAQFYIGIACMEKKDIEAAKWELARVAEITAQNPDRGALIQARNKLALIYHGANDRSKSAQIAREVIADNAVAPNDKAWAKVILGCALVGDKRTEEGLEILNNVRQEYSEFQEPLLMAELKVFDTVLGKHDYDSLMAQCRTILADQNACEARTRQAGTYLIRALEYKKEYDIALSEIQILMDRFNYTIEEQRAILGTKARILALAKNYNGAIECYNTVLATNPTETEFCASVEWNLSMCYRLTGQHSLADQRLVRIIELYPTSHLAVRAAGKLGQR